jgi:hypothetical protein
MSRSGVFLLLTRALFVIGVVTALAYPTAVRAQCPGSFSMFIPTLQNGCATIRFQWGYAGPNVVYQVEAKRAGTSYASKGTTTTALTIDININEFAPRGNYWDFRVRATVNGCTTYSYEYFGFWVPLAPTTPTAVTATSLPNGQIRISWDPYSQTNQQALIYKNGATTPFAQPSYSLGQYVYTEPSCGNFYFQVTGQSQGGCVSAKVLTPSVTRTPNTPVLTAPADNASQVSGDVTFTWQAASCASTYNLQVDTENTFTAPLTVDQSVTGTTALWAAAPAGTYYWRVRACNAGGCSPSGYRTLTITAASLPITITSPIGGENWAPGSQQTVTWSGGGTVRIDLFADGTPVSGSLSGPFVTLSTTASGGSATVTLPADIATTRARIQLQRTSGPPNYSYSPNTFKIVTPPASGIWTYLAADDPQHGWNQSDMCSNGQGGVYGVWLDYLGGREDLRFGSRLNKTKPWTKKTAKSASKVGSWPSIVRGSDGTVHVAYYDHTVYGAKLYYTFGNPETSDPSTWPQELISDIYVVQGDCSIALDQNNVPYVAFNTGNLNNTWKLRVYKRQGTNSWANFGNWYNEDIFWPHHITLKYAGNNRFWVACTDGQTANRLNVWAYNAIQWVKLTVTNFPAGPYTDVSMTLDMQGNPYLAYTVPNNGGQKLIFHPWSFEDTGMGTPVTIDASLGTISSVSLQNGWLYPRLGYVGNGVVKQATGIYSETNWPCDWTRQIVDATGNMDSQVSLVVNIGNDERWYLYRDLTTQSMRLAGPYYVDPPPPAVTDLGFTAGYEWGSAFWTAPNDGNGNQVIAYDLRYNISPVTEGNFYSSTQVSTNAPQPPGSPECLDIDLSPCRTYYWAIKSLDEWGNWSSVSNSPGDATSCSIGPEFACALGPNVLPADRAELPQVLSIGQISPNPTRSPIVIPLSIPAGLSDADIGIDVFDVSGRLIRTIDSGKAEAGVRNVGWDLREASGAKASSGVYFVRVTVGTVVENRRVLLVR